MERRMSDETITPDNVTRDRLQGILNAAFIDYSIDSDGDIVTRDRLKCVVLPLAAKSTITLRAYFGLSESADRAELLEAVNASNSEYMFARAVVVNDFRSLVFQADIPLAGGISPKCLVCSLRRFCQIPHDACRDHFAPFMD